MVLTANKICFTFLKKPCYHDYQLSALSIKKLQNRAPTSSSQKLCSILSHYAKKIRFIPIIVSYYELFAAYSPAFFKHKL